MAPPAPLPVPFELPSNWIPDLPATPAATEAVLPEAPPTPAAVPLPPVAVIPPAPPPPPPTEAPVPGAPPAPPENVVPPVAVAVPAAPPSAEVALPPGLQTIPVVAQYEVTVPPAAPTCTATGKVGVMLSRRP